MGRLLHIISIWEFWTGSSQHNLAFTWRESPMFLFDACRTIVLWGAYGATLVALLIFLYLCWMDGFCVHHRPTSMTPMAGGNTGDYDSGLCADRVISSSRWIRLAMFLISVVLIASCAVITLVSSLSGLIQLQFLCACQMCLLTLWKIHIFQCIVRYFPHHFIQCLTKMSHMNWKIMFSSNKKKRTPWRLICKQSIPPGWQLLIGEF